MQARQNAAAGPSAASVPLRAVNTWAWRWAVAAWPRDAAAATDADAGTPPGVMAAERDGGGPRGSVVAPAGSAAAAATAVLSVTGRGGRTASAVTGMAATTRWTGRQSRRGSSHVTAPSTPPG